jgi:hypothetical protein
VNRSTICKYVKKHQRLQLLIQELTEEITDIAESHLIVALRGGKEWAIKLWLQERAQERGYGTRRLAFKDGEGNVSIPAVLVTDGRMTEEDWLAKYGNAGSPSAVEPSTTH